MKDKLIEAPMVTIDNYGLEPYLVVHNCINQFGKPMLTVDKTQAALLLIEIWKFINDGKTDNAQTNI